VSGVNRNVKQCVAPYAPARMGLGLFHNDRHLTSRFPQSSCQSSGGRGARGLQHPQLNSAASKLGGLMRWVWFRVAAAIVASSGVIAGLLVNIDRATREGQVRGDVLANYFSLFTIVSSILSVVVLTIAARWMLRHPGPSPEPVGIAIAVAAVTGPVILLGIVFNMLLRGDPAPIAATDPGWVSFMDSWATETLHVVGPIYFVIDLLGSRGRRLPSSSVTRSCGRSTRCSAENACRAPTAARPGGTPTGSSTRTRPGTGRRSRTSAASCSHS